MDLFFIALWVRYPPAAKCRNSFCLPRPRSLQLLQFLYSTISRPRSATFSYKGSDSQYLGFVGHMASVTNTFFSCFSTKSAIGQLYILKEVCVKIYIYMWTCSRLQPTIPWRYMSLEYVVYSPCDTRIS